jgi:GT2 family glycosyltransferase
MKLSIVIVNYNVKQYVENCLRSVYAAGSGIDMEIFVVDNASSDDSVAYLQERFPEVRYIENKSNLGFSKANNVAIRQATGEYVLLLNPDTTISEDVLQECIRFADAHPKTGALGVCMHNEDGSVAPESRRAVPTPWIALCKYLGYSRRYYMAWLPWDKPCRIEVVSGAFCFLRHTALKEVGLLDEDYFMYGEDIDLSYQLLRHGYENWYLPLNIIHFKGRSTIKTSFRYAYVFYKAMLIFFVKHYLSFLHIYK